MNLSMLGAAHSAAAIAALLFGFVVLADRKGTNAHRAIGSAYVAAMIAANLTAFGIYRLTGQFGPFHALALVSLLTVARGVAAVLRRRPGWLVTHYYSMGWSYIGLTAAACAEVIVRSPLLSGAVHNRRDGMLVGLACAAAFMIVGIFLLPRLQARSLADLREG
jgi:uncharacterized membrane protein